MREPNPRAAEGPSRTPWTGPLSQTTLAQLQQALESSEAMLSFPAACGVLAAVATAPQTVPPSIWLELIKGEHTFEHTDQVQGFAAGLRALHDAVVESLANHGANCCPGPEAPQAVREFCQGYAAIASRDATWEADERAFVELLPMFALGGLTPMEEVAALLPSAADDPEAWLARAREELPRTVSALYEYWAPRKQPVPANVPRVKPIRAGAKVGRNDPCPCGSGKKYKRCCMR